MVYSSSSSSLPKVEPSTEISVAISLLFKFYIKAADAVDETTRIEAHNLLDSWGLIGE